MSRLLVVLLLLAPGGWTFADDPALTLADLGAYRSALLDRSGEVPSKVGFRDLWDRPATFAGRRVAVEGRVARVFRQPPMGEFPALVEAWIVSEAGDPFCLVFPGAAGRSVPGIGTWVRFAGTFLRRIRYEGGDQPRLAPLIVGPESPSFEVGAVAAGSSWSPGEWLVGLGAAAVLALALARRHLARPIGPPPSLDPPPSFLDGEPGPGAGPC